MLRLRNSATSPYVRKVRVLLLETGLEDRVELIDTQVTPTNPNAELNVDNPIGKVPVLLTENGMALYDSPVICEYLDSLHSGTKMFPVNGVSRWLALRRQALGDGLLDAAILGRYESTLRPAAKLWQDWLDAQIGKIDRSLDAMEAEALQLEGVINIGTITIACALGYLDFRYSEMNWRSKRPALTAWFDDFSRRPSMAATVAPNADPLER